MTDEKYTVPPMAQYRPRTIAHGNALLQAYDLGRITAIRHLFVDALNAICGDEKAERLRNELLAWVNENPEPSAEAGLFGDKL